MWPFDEARLLEVKYNAIIPQKRFGYKSKFVVKNLPKID